MIFYFIFFLIIVIFRIWFLELSILTSGDWLYLMSQTQTEMFSFPHIWNTSGLGHMDLGLTMYPIILSWGIFSSLGFGFSERLLYMIPSIVFAYFGSYFLLRQFFNNKYAVQVGVLVYTLNTYFMTARTGHLNLMVGFALAPIIIFFLHKFLTTRKKAFLFLSILVSIVTSYYEFRAFYLILAIIGLITLYSMTIERLLTLKRFLFLLLVFFGSIWLANMFWILPFQMTDFFSGNEITGRALFGNSFMRIDRAFGLFHPFWSGGEIIPFEVQMMPIYMWLLPFVAFSGLYISRKNPIIVLYSVIAISGIFLTKQSNQPYAQIYEWFYNNLPGFNAFREATKFYFFIALGYSVLISGFIDRLLQIKSTSKLIIMGKYLTPLFIAGIFLWNTKPIITGEIGTLFVARTVPNDYVQFKDAVVNHDNFYRTLWVPVSSRWSIYTNNHPAISLLSTNWTCKESVECTQILTKNISDRLLDEHSVKYVIVPIQDFENDDDFFIHFGKSRNYYITELSKLSYLKRINIENGDLAVFENSNFKPRIYLSDNKVIHSSVNPTQYNLIISLGDEPTILHFTETYHPDWKLRIGHFSWFDSLFQSNYYYPDTYHSLSDIGLHQWKINPDWLHSEGFKRGDSVPITLYFAPQAYTYVGGIVSVLFVTLITVYALYAIINRK